MKRGRKPNIRKILEKNELKKNRARVRKHYQYILKNHDIAQLLITGEHEDEKLCIAMKLSLKFRHKVIQFYNEVFSKRVPARIIDNHMIMEVSRDLRTSIHLAQFAYYKAANSILRNVFETGFRFLYFSQYPKRFADFGKTEDWHSIKKKEIEKIKFNSDETTKDFLEHYYKLCKYSHTYPSTFGTNFIGFNTYNEKLFDEWFINIKDTINILEKSFKDFTL